MEKKLQQGNQPTGFANLPTGSRLSRREKRFWNKPVGQVHAEGVQRCRQVLVQTFRHVQARLGERNASATNMSDRFYEGVDRFLEISGGPRILYLNSAIELESKLDRRRWSPEITQLSSPNA